MTDQPLSEGEIIPVMMSYSSGEAALSHAGGGGGFTHWLTDCFDVQPTTTSGNIITQRACFQLLASANSFVYFASSAACHWRICMSVIAAARYNQMLCFVALGFVGNGVIIID